MERWTRFVLRHRWPVVAIWLCVLLVGGYLSSGLSKLLSNEFTVPGTDSEEVRLVLAEHFGQRDDGSFLVVFRGADARHAAERRELQAALTRGATALPAGRALPVQAAGDA